MRSSPKETAAGADADHRLSLSSSPADGISHQQSLSQEPPTVLSITNCTYKKYIYY